MKSEINFQGLSISPGQQRAVARIVRFVTRFGLLTPSILALESVRPLSVVGAQSMHLLSPMAAVLSPMRGWDDLACLLDDRRGLDYLLNRLENASVNTDE